MKNFLNSVQCFSFFVLGALLLTSQQTYAQIDPPTQSQDSTGVVVRGTIQLTDVDKIIRSYTYDPDSDRYIYRVQIDDYDMEYPLVLTRKQ